MIKLLRRFLLSLCLSSAASAFADLPSSPSAEELAAQAVIYRDAFGVPHIDGKTDEAVCFAFGYAQAEDYFWQVEDSLIMSLGRYAEVNGELGLHNDLLNKAFEIVPRSKLDYPKLEPEVRAMCDAFTAGINYYLQKHPETKPRIVTRFEGWHVMALTRHVFMYFTLMTKYIPRKYFAGDVTEPHYPGGSNAWAIAPRRTKSGAPILFCNPHQPAFGFGQFYEAHLRSEAGGWNFSGATFFGGPMLAIGHNEHLGWSHTVNRPDNVDFWRVRFDNPSKPDDYRFDDGYKTAEKWSDVVKVKAGAKLLERPYTFRKTIHGPIVGAAGPNEFYAIGMSKLMDSFAPRQHRQMVRARNLTEFKAAMAPIDLTFFNTVYADRDGNIFFVYNGAIPRRDPQFDWTKTLDGATSKTLWKGLHSFEELPSVTNPLSGFIQSCNSSPYTSTDDGNPLPIDFPKYMADDGHLDNLRSKVSRLILRDLQQTTFEDVEKLAFDTRMYWPIVELPQYRDGFAALEKQNPSLAEKVKPLLTVLLDWDGRNREDCVQSTLCAAWYEIMYGTLYPPDGTLKPEYAASIEKRYEALLEAAAKLQKTFGKPLVPWGDVYRIQRHADVAEFLSIPFSDKKPSIPCIAGPGAMGMVFTQYYTPSINIPFVKEMNKHYGVVGTSYIAVFEFGKDKVRGSTLTQFGASGNPKSPYFFDQAKLMSEHKLKAELFDWDDVRANAKRNYRPGDEGRASSAAN